jgi:hypothetical protein
MDKQDSNSAQDTQKHTDQKTTKGATSSSQSNADHSHQQPGDAGNIANPSTGNRPEAGPSTANRLEASPSTANPLEPTTSRRPSMFKNKAGGEMPSINLRQKGHIIFIKKR